MLEHDWQQVQLDLETGICLWMGAGVSTHLSRSIGGSVPDWGELTRALEVEADFPESKRQGSLPERLQACTSKLGGARVRRKIARDIYGQLCLQIAKFAYEHRGTLGELPEAVTQLAALGWRANPIVNFNIETFTSILAARPGGPCRILPYRIRKDAASGMYEDQEIGSDFPRVVYHPHGAVNYSGHAVMTSDEYATHNGSLAYLLSVAAAFENNLWICGMSLDDEYLRKELATYRRQINRIRWFNTPHDLAKHETWARQNDITAVPVDWRVFWQLVGMSLGPQIRLSGAMSAWYCLIETAISELLDGTPGEQLADLATRFPALGIATGKASSQGEYRKVFDKNEGAGLLPAGFPRKEITDEIAEIVNKEAEFVTVLMAELTRQYGAAARDIVSALEVAKPVRAQMRHMDIE
jgi:hypothetical protein